MTRVVKIGGALLEDPVKAADTIGPLVKDRTVVVHDYPHARTYER
jgi:hypothetical protein